MVSQRLAKPSYPLDSLSSTLSVGATYTLGVMVAYAAPTRLVRVRIFEGMPIYNIGERQRGRVGPDCKSGVFRLSGFESHLPDQKNQKENIMRKSVKREYELDRSYDYADSYGFKNTKRNVGFVKRRAHKRLRRQLKKNMEG